MKMFYWLVFCEEMSGHFFTGFMALKCLALNQLFQTVKPVISVQRAKSVLIAQPVQLSQPAHLAQLAKPVKSSEVSTFKKSYPSYSI